MEFLIWSLNFENNYLKLLQLKSSLEFTEWVQPIALPAAMEETEAGTDCTVTGWGTLNVSFFIPYAISIDLE